MVILASSLFLSMDLQSFMTVLLYEYEWFLCVGAFTLLLCFIFEAVLHWIYCYAILMGVCLTAYYLHLHLLKLSELAAADTEDRAAIVAYLPTLTPEFPRATIVQMWSTLWLAYWLAPAHPLDEQGHFIPWYKGCVHYSVPLLHVSLHIPSPDTCWALPYHYQLVPGKDSRVERHREDHDYLPGNRLDPSVAHSYPPLDARAQQLYNEFLEHSQLCAKRHVRRQERE